MTRLATLLTLLAFSGAQACTYCDPANLKLQTLRQEARTSKFVFVGTLNNPRLVGDSGVTDILVEQVVKNDPTLGKKKAITLPRWMPVDPKKPPRMLLFVDVYEGKNIGEGKKAYAVSFVLEDFEQTLNDKVIDATMQKLMTSFENELGAIIRK